MAFSCTGMNRNLRMCVVCSEDVLDSYLLCEYSICHGGKVPSGHFLAAEIRATLVEVWEM